MNFDNTIFSFTRIMWLSDPMRTLSALVADWPCRAILTEYVKTCSVVFEGHFEFFVQVIGDSAAQIGVRKCRRTRFFLASEYSKRDIYPEADSCA